MRIPLAVAAFRKALPLLLCAASTLCAVEIPLEIFGYSDLSQARARWRPASNSPAVDLARGPDQTAAVEVPVAMDTLTTWRFFWDHSLSTGFDGCDRLEITARSDDPRAFAAVIPHFESRRGWYTLEGFVPSTEWATYTVPLKETWVDGTPAGWDVITAIRLSALPGEKIPSSLQVASIVARGGYKASDIGAVGAFSSLDQALDSVRHRQDALRSPEIAARLDSIQAIVDTLANNPGLANWQTETLVFRGQQLLGEAWALAQDDPGADELRGIWCHMGNGYYWPRGIAGWDTLMPVIDALGINALFVNMLWSGVAYYPSDVVPRHYTVRQGADHLADLLRWRDSTGIQIHVWKVMFQFSEGWLASALEDGSLPSDRWRREGRLQITRTGDTTAWLSPCDSVAMEYEIDAMKELATRYPVDGLHLDYIRFSGTDVDYNPTCRARFERWSGISVDSATWPAEVLSGENADLYARFRMHLIDTIVQRVHDEVLPLRPGMKLSAAVFAALATAKEQVMQNWPLWAQRGWVDFLAPMAYTNSFSRFAGQISADKAALEGTGVEIYPGIGAFDNMPLATLVDEIREVRRQGFNGFVIFDLDSNVVTYQLPYVASGLFGVEGLQLPDTRRWFAEKWHPVSLSPGSANPTTAPRLLWRRDGESLVVQAPSPGNGRVRLLRPDGRLLAEGNWREGREARLRVGGLRGQFVLEWSGARSRGAEPVVLQGNR